MRTSKDTDPGTNMPAVTEGFKWRVSETVMDGSLTVDLLRLLPAEEWGAWCSDPYRLAGGKSIDVEHRARSVPQTLWDRLWRRERTYWESRWRKRARWVTVASREVLADADDLDILGAAQRILTRLRLVGEYPPNKLREDRL